MRGSTLRSVDVLTLTILARVVEKLRRGVWIAVAVVRRRRGVAYRANSIEGWKAKRAAAAKRAL